MEFLPPGAPSASGLKNPGADSAAAPLGQSRLFGLVRRRVAWTLSGRGWLAVCCLFLLGGAGVAFSLHPFLAQTRRVDADFLVVEGWIPEYALREAVAFYRQQPCRGVFTTGGPFADEADSHADVAARRLAQLGIPTGQVRSVPDSKVSRERTYASALALRDFMEKQSLKFSGLNVVTLGPHARRTRLMFEQAFGPQVRIGVIAIPNRGYDPRHWWRNNEGLKDVVTETLAYVYAKCL